MSRPAWIRVALVGLGSVLVLSAVSTVVVAQQGDLRPRDWLRIAPDDDTRWRLLEGCVPYRLYIRSASLPP